VTTAHDDFMEKKAYINSNRNRLMSGIEIFSSRGLKKNLKLALVMKRLVSRGLIFGGFFNPWEEEISIPNIQLIGKSLIFGKKKVFSLKMVSVNKHLFIK
jgi:hypothetical protein